MNKRTNLFYYLEKEKFGFMLTNKRCSEFYLDNIVLESKDTTWECGLCHQCSDEDGMGERAVGLLKLNLRLTQWFRSTVLF